ncbi:MAG TPA: sulfatase-like hydrolase/transferase [Firmicutes bacterium]|nr:sulfatase-like hydrolase/transferase [Bacillota bacterium]
MDKLAVAGIYFEQAFANVPMCTPNRAVMLSGCYPIQNRVPANDIELSPSQARIN